MKNTLKKVTALVLLFAMCVLCCACGETKKDDTIKVGICNYVDDASLNQIVDNIKTRLNELAKEKNVEIEIDYDNCNADSLVLSQIINNFINDDVDLMIAVATPVAIAMQAATEDSDIPVVFAAVSDPVSTGLVKSLDAPEGNLTGTSDYLDTNAILNIMFALNPDMDKVGLLYDNSQDSSETPIAAAKKYLEEKGINYVETTGTSSEEVSLAADALIYEGVDAVFTPTDNTIMKNELNIYEKFAEAGIPHFAGADSFALNGAFMGYGVDYALLGVETANMAAEILFDGKAPSELAVRTFDNGTATVNTEICTALGLDFAEVEKTISPLCTKVEQIVTAEDFN